MPIDERTAAGLARLAIVVPNESRMLDLAMLAGNGLAASLAAVRANQARREASRAKLKFGAKSPELARKIVEAEAAQQLVKSIDAEIARLALEPPVPAEGEIAVYGYLRDDEKPVAGLAVSLEAPGSDTKIETRTADDGSFKLSGTSPGPLGLVVRKGASIVSADVDPWYTPSPRAYYRLIDIGTSGTRTPDPAVPPSRGEPKDDSPKPNRSPYVGLTLNQALLMLAKEERRLSRIVLKIAADRGHITDAKADSRSGAVTLVLAVNEGNADRMDCLAVLMVQEPPAAQIGIVNIEQARSLLRTAKLESLEDVKALLALTDDSIARRTSMGRGGQAKILREVLTSALDKIEIG